MRKYPLIANKLLYFYDAWIVGSAANEAIKNPRDLDIVVPFKEWNHAAQLIPRDATVNSLGGFKFKDEDVMVDVWPADIHSLLTASASKHFYHPWSETRIIKEHPKNLEESMQGRTVEDLRGLMLSHFNKNCDGMHGLDITTLLGAEIEKLKRNTINFIPVKETLPSEAGYYLVKGKYFETENSGVHCSTAYFKDGEWFANECLNYRYTNIFEWSNLPIALHGLLGFR